jgi:hypothetical protein
MSLHPIRAKLLHPARANFKAFIGGSLINVFQENEENASLEDIIRDRKHSWLSCCFSVEEKVELPLL